MTAMFRKVKETDFKDLFFKKRVVSKIKHY